MYIKGYLAAAKELDIIHIVKTIHKLKAGLAMVIENDLTLNKTAQKMYLENTTIFCDSEEEKVQSKFSHHNTFVNFIKAENRSDEVK